MNIDNSKLPENKSEFLEDDAVTSYVTPETTDEVVEETVEQEEVVEKTDDELAAELAKVEEPTDEVKPSKHLSKEESKIVALKKQNQKLLEDYRALATRIEEIETSKRHVELKKTYIDKGIDEEEAESYAKRDIESDKTLKRLEMLEFKLDNESIFREYPEANKDILRIMNTVKSSGMTVEQVCRGLYGTSEPLRETRAKKAATGELEDENTTASVASAQRTATTKTPVTLSKADIDAKRRYENAFRGGEKLTNAEWLERKAKYNLKV